MQYKSIFVQYFKLLIDMQLNTQKINCCISIAIRVMQTSHNVMLYKHCLSYVILKSKTYHNHPHWTFGINNFSFRTY